MRADAAPSDDRRESSLGRLVPETVATLVMVSVCLFIRSKFGSLVSPVLLAGWLAYMIACIAARVGSVALAIGRGSVEPRGPGGRFITFAFCLGIVAAVWLFMPAADPMLRLILIILCMWFIAMVIILNPDRLSLVGALAVIGSMAAFVLAYDMPYKAEIAGFLLMESAALFLVRRASLRVAQAMRDALGIVQAERDAKTRFLAAASHDLQQPLQAARLYFDQAVSGPEARRARAVEGAHSAFGSTQRLLDSMLEHLRLEADAMPANVAPIAVRPVLEATRREHEPSLRAANLEVRLAGDARAFADEHLLRRIASNLLANIVKHARCRRALMVARRRGACAELWFLDDGVGVAPADRARLFDDYFQGSAGAGHAPSGFGLGLASVRRMAALMGGSVELDRRWTRGSAFVVRLPAQVAPGPG